MAFNDIVGGIIACNLNGKKREGAGVRQRKRKKAGKVVAVAFGKSAVAKEGGGVAGLGVWGRGRGRAGSQIPVLAGNQGLMAGPQLSVISAPGSFSAISYLLCRDWRGDECRG